MTWAGGCTRNLVHEKAILGYLLPKLQEMLLSPKNVERLTAALRRLARQERPGATGTAALRKRLDGLDRELAEAARELKRTPDDLYDLAVADVRRLREERSAIVDALEAATARRGAGQADAEGRVQAALERATRLQEALGAAEPKAVRHALGELVERIDLFFEPQPGPKITRSSFTRGVVRLREGSQLVARASGNDQLGTSLTLAFTAADLPLREIVVRRAATVEVAVEFVRAFLRSGTRHSRDVEQAAKAAECSLQGGALPGNQHERQRDVDPA